MSEKQSHKKLAQIDLAPRTPLKLFVWKVRRLLRSVLSGKDVLAIETAERNKKSRVREVYRQLDAFMLRFFPRLQRETPKDVAALQVRDVITQELGYTIVDEDMQKPWGAYFRMSNDEADRFIGEFFPGLDPDDARLGRDDVELSPKIMIVAPAQRLSWQYHHRRAERWRFLTDGGYYRSMNDEPGVLNPAHADTIVQFIDGERHRLCAMSDSYTLVAEIWQHTEPTELSNEADIVRLQDDYQR